MGLVRSILLCALLASCTPVPNGSAATAERTPSSLSFVKDEPARAFEPPQPRALPPSPVRYSSTGSFSSIFGRLTLAYPRALVPALHVSSDPPHELWILQHSTRPDARLLVAISAPFAGGSTLSCGERVRVPGTTWGPCREVRIGGIVWERRQRERRGVVRDEIVTIRDDVRYRIALSVPRADHQRYERILISVRLHRAQSRRPWGHVPF